MLEARPSPTLRAGIESSVVVSASLDNLRSPQVRFLQEARRWGNLHLRLWCDALVESRTGSPPLFPQAERLFLSRALRYVDGAGLVRLQPAVALPELASRHDTLVVNAAELDRDLRARCLALGMGYEVIGADDLVGFPPAGADASDAPGRRRVVVTGCFDWLHSGHIQFFLDAAALGDLYVIVGSDENVRFLKGPGHPLRPQEERRYMVQSVRSVHRALISTGSGWMDAEPEISSIAPDIYVVNKDGDQPEKRGFCRAHGLDYVVLERRPHRDLPSRTSTELRGY
jgi:cytidyltransferase-like protein